MSQGSRVFVSREATALLGIAGLAVVGVVGGLEAEAINDPPGDVAAGRACDIGLRPGVGERLLGRGSAAMVTMPDESAAYTFDEIGVIRMAIASAAMTKAAIATR